MVVVVVCGESNGGRGAEQVGCVERGKGENKTGRDAVLSVFMKTESERDIWAARAMWLTALQ